VSVVTTNLVESFRTLDAQSKKLSGFEALTESYDTINLGPVAQESKTLAAMLPWEARQLSNFLSHLLLKSCY
jgi:hypothetical protein